MPKANLDAIVASLKVAISYNHSLSDLNELHKEFLGKDSFLIELSV